MVCVFPGMFPASINVAPNSPSALAKHKTAPERIALPASGTETNKNNVNSFAPSTRAASSISPLTGNQTLPTYLCRSARSHLERKKKYWYENVIAAMNLKKAGPGAGFSRIKPTHSIVIKFSYTFNENMVNLCY